MNTPLQWTPSGQSYTPIFFKHFYAKEHKLNAKQRIQCNSLDVYNIMLIYHNFKKWAIGCQAVAIINLTCCSRHACLNVA